MTSEFLHFSQEYFDIHICSLLFMFVPSLLFHFEVNFYVRGSENLTPRMKVTLPTAF
jgi:hypothetical protein